MQIIFVILMQPCSHWTSRSHATRPRTDRRKREKVDRLNSVTRVARVTDNATIAFPLMYISKRKPFHVHRLRFVHARGRQTRRHRESKASNIAALLRSDDSQNSHAPVSAANSMVREAACAAACIKGARRALLGKAPRFRARRRGLHPDDRCR